MSRLTVQDLKKTLFYPVRALISRDFYFSVLFRMKGTGVLYLFVLSVVLAIPAAWRSMGVLEYFKSLEISTLVAQIPSSYLDQHGTLSPNSEDDAYKLIYNSHGVPAVVYNTQGRALEGDALQAPVEFTSQHIRVSTQKGVTEIPYTGFFETGSNFNPVAAADSAEMILNADLKMIWSALVMWFFILLVFNTLVSACLARFMMLFVFRIRMKFISALRLCAFANTIVAVLILAQFYFYLPVSYTIMILMPLLYMAAFSRAFRRELAQSGLEIFKAKYQKMREDARREREGRPPRQEKSYRTAPDENQSSDDDGRNDHRKGPGSGYFEA